MQQYEAAIEDPRLHHDVGIDRPVRQPETLGQHSAPALRLAAGILVADQQRRLHLFKKRFERIIRRPPHHESHAALRCVLLNIAETLGQEVVVAQVGVGIVRNHGEVHHYRQAEKIPRFNRNIKRRIVDDAHSPLHPVDDALCAGTWRPAAPHDDAGLVGQLRELFGNLRCLDDKLHP